MLHWMSSIVPAARLPSYATLMMVGRPRLRRGPVQEDRGALLEHIKIAAVKWGCWAVRRGELGPTVCVGVGRDALGPSSRIVWFLVSPFMFLHSAAMRCTPLQEQPVQAAFPGLESSHSTARHDERRLHKKKKAAVICLESSSGKHASWKNRNPTGCGIVAWLSRQSSRCRQAGRLQVLLPLPEAVAHPQEDVLVVYPDPGVRT